MSIHFSVITAWLTLLGSPLAAAPSPQPPHYAVTDLGVGLRTSESGPAGINDAGDVAGTLEASSTSGEHRVFLFHRGQIVGTGHHSRDGRSADGLTRMFLLTPDK